MSGSGSKSGGISFLGLLAIVFIVLKLIDKIDWSWWWVLSPLWIPVACLLGFLVFCGVMAMLAAVLKVRR